jgi:thymidylate synthase (FAD)
MTIEVQAPIFVFREWMRHRTFSYSEASARYAPLPDLNYIPSVDRLLMGADGTNKQAGAIKGAKVLDESRAMLFRDYLETVYANAEKFYQEALADGVPKELARIVLPVGRYSRMRASGNLRNWLQFLTLRLDTAAQWEIREYAKVVGEMVAQRFPRTWELFAEGLK